MESIGLSAGNFGLLLSLLLGLLFGICLCFASQYIWGRKKHIVLVVIAVIAVIFTAICVVSFFYIEIKEKDSFANWMRGMGLFAGAVFAAPFGLYLARQRTDTLMQQTKNEGKRIISEEFSRSVALLGNDKATVRQGGIYALGRLAKDDEEMRDTIMKIVCSFVRGTGEKNSITTPNGTDIEAALYVIRKREKTQKEKTQKEKTQSDFDISNSVLENGDLSNTSLADFNLSDIKATGCIFKGTNFTKANLVSAKFGGKCDFGNATFTEAKLNGAIFGGGCDFGNAEFNQADVSNADLSKEYSLTQKQVNAMRGNGKTKLPPNISRPPEWKYN